MEAAIRTVMVKLTEKNIGKYTIFSKEEIFECTGIKALNTPRNKHTFEGIYPKLDVKTSSSGFLLINQYDFELKTVLFSLPEGDESVQRIFNIFTSQTNFLIKKPFFKKMVYLPNKETSFEKNMIKKLGFIQSSENSDEMIFDLSENSESFKKLKSSRESLR